MKCSSKFLVSASANITMSPRATDRLRHMASPLPWAGPQAGRRSFFRSAVDEMLIEILGIGIGEHHDVAARHRQAPPHGIALALGRAEGREQFVLRVHLGAPRTRDAARAIR